MPIKLCIFSVPTWICVILLLIIFLHGSESSSGERSKVYRQCLYWCSLENCSTPYVTQFKSLQPWYMSLLLWECEDECQYSCMWHAVRHIQRRGQSVPQFYGKWPFIRFFGIQEPASVIFSILNGLSHYFMWKKLKRAVPHISGFNVWNIQAILSINAWVCSSIFHARDTPITEKLDYYAAFLLILYSLYSLTVKIFAYISPLVIFLPFLLFFTYHIYYLTYVKFDYGYNLKLTAVIACAHSLGWLLWYYKNRHKSHVWKCAISIVVIKLLFLLELGDFPPWGFIVDAHALWHLGTIPVPFLWYSFLIEEFLYEKKIKKEV